MGMGVSAASLKKGQLVCLLNEEQRVMFVHREFEKPRTLRPSTAPAPLQGDTYTRLARHAKDAEAACVSVNIPSAIALCNSAVGFRVPNISPDAVFLVEKKGNEIRFRSLRCPL